MQCLTSYTCTECDPNGGGDGKTPLVVEPTSVDILILVLSIVGAIVLIGIILLILLRLATHLHDKREYTRFKKEQQSAVWDEVVIITKSNKQIFSIFF